MKSTEQTVLYVFVNEIFMSHEIQSSHQNVNEQE